MKKHLIHSIFTSCLTFAIMTFCCLSGMAQEVPSTGTYYQIVSKHSGKVLDVKGGTDMKKNGSAVHLWTSHGGDNQLFRLEQVGEGYYSIIAKHSGKVVDVTGGESKTCNGIAIQQWQNHRAKNQLFRLVPKGEGYYQIVAKHSGKALDVYQSKKNDGAKLVQYDSHGGANQLFRFVRSSGEDIVSESPLGPEY